jgi:hypothetical protein
MTKSTVWFFLAMVVVGIVIVVVAVSFQGNGHAAVTKKTTREIALTCTTDMATQFHIHPSLVVVVDGKTQQIPTGIGVQPTCMTSLHTHDATGLIHIEAPEKRDFTLGDFFAAWKQPFNQSEILGYKTDATHRIRVLVNGSEVNTFENTVFVDKDQITISYETLSQPK